MEINKKLEEVTNFIGNMAEAYLPNLNDPPYRENSFVGFHQEDITDSQNIIRKIHNHTNNATYNSFGNKSVVLFHPNSNELMNNPLKLASAINDSVLKKFQEEGKIKNIRTNKKRNIIAIELANKDDKIIDEILKIEKLGNFEVTTQLPNTDELKFGVISPIDTDVNLESIKQVIKIRNSSSSGQQVGEITQIERLKKLENGTWIDSMSLKISFKKCNLPEGISIFHSYYKVRPYIGNNFQCFKCQRMGHMAKSCKSRERCLLCGGNHNRKECNSQQHKCANCAGPHRANSKECQYYALGKKIEKVRVTESKTYLEAKNKVLHEKNVLNQPIEIERRNGHLPQPSSSTSYRDLLVGRNNKRETREMETQTEGPKDDELFFQKLKKCILTIMEQARHSDMGMENIIEEAVQDGFHLQPKRLRGDLSSSSSSICSISMPRSDEVGIQAKEVGTKKTSKDSTKNNKKKKVENNKSNGRN